MCGRVVVVKTLSREDQELEFEAYQQALALASGTGPQELGLQGMAAAAQSSKQWDDALAAASGGRGDHAWPPQEPSFNLPPAVPPGANQLPAKGGVEARRPSPLATATAVDATVNTDPAAAALRTHTDPRAVTAGALSSRSSTTSAGGGGADSGIGPDTIVLGPHRDSQAHIRAAPTPASTPMAAATAPTYSSMMAGMVSPSSANLAHITATLNDVATMQQSPAAGAGTQASPTAAGAAAPTHYTPITSLVSASPVPSLRQQAIPGMTAFLRENLASGSPRGGTTTTTPSAAAGGPSSIATAGAPAISPRGNAGPAAGGGAVGGDAGAAGATGIYIGRGEGVELRSITPADAEEAASTAAGIAGRAGDGASGETASSGSSDEIASRI